MRIRHLLTIVSCAAGIFLPPDSALAASGQSSLMAALEARYKSRQTAAMTIQQDGITAVPLGVIGFIDNKIVDGKIQPQGRWDKMTTWVPTLALSAGESVFVSKISIKNDQVRLTVVTYSSYDVAQRYTPSQYTAVLSFRFTENFLAPSFTRYLNGADPRAIENAIEAILTPSAGQSNPAATAQTALTSAVPAAPVLDSSPSTVALGQTVDQVTAALGSPEKIIDLGVKKILVYKALKVTFLNGKVSDVD